jgi:hypothetical protein
MIQCGRRSYIRRWRIVVYLDIRVVVSWKQELYMPRIFRYTRPVISIKVHNIIIKEKMKYVKLTARPNTWFVAGTEAYHYGSEATNKYRITLEEWQNDWVPYGVILARGTRLSNCEKAERVPKGSSYFDGEACNIEEFDSEIVDEKL